MKNVKNQSEAIGANMMKLLTEKEVRNIAGAQTRATVPPSTRNPTTHIPHI